MKVRMIRNWVTVAFGFIFSVEHLRHGRLESHRTGMSIAATEQSISHFAAHPRCKCAVLWTLSFNISAACQTQKEGLQVKRRSWDTVCTNQLDGAAKGQCFNEAMVVECLRCVLVNDRNSNNGDGMASNLIFIAHCFCAFKIRVRLR